MHFSSSFVLLAVAALTTQAVPLLQSRASSNCTNPKVRIEWSNLTSLQQTAYLDAVLCLWQLPAQTNLRNVTNRYTDLVALHQNLTAFVHWDGPFLPWHRYFVHTHETLLREECNYTGFLPSVSFLAFFMRNTLTDMLIVGGMSASMQVPSPTHPSSRQIHLVPSVALHTTGQFLMKTQQTMSV